uniref:programmed cell death protein 2-like n=1 Tax=Solea senegalensis TaxID=28829 RepID=UPI001CD8FF82|nr:programmed cell death protein 2-like [Solea senegalensis]
MASSAQEVILLGVCDGELEPKRHRSSHLTNKVGGHPDWSPVISPPWPRCGHCGAPLAHVAQIYCPLEASPYHRTLRLFACPGAECCGRAESWRAIRSQSLEAEREPSRSVPAQEAPLSATDWCDSADDWGVEEEGDGWGGGGGVKEEAEAGGAVLSCRLQDLSLGESHDDVPVFRSFFVSVVDESDLRGEDDLDHAQQLLREYESREGVAVGGLDCGEGVGDRGQEKYEKSRARHGDAIFSRFMKRISICPQQILRYCRGGRPLFISEPPANTAPVVAPCGSCGGSRTFELQLMPALVSQLRRKDAEAELEFGTVLVYTCTNSCWTEGSGSAVEEFCYVQGDPDQKLFK